MNRPRAVVLGAGAQVFAAHRPAFERGLFELVGVQDADDERLEALAATLGVPATADVDELLGAARPDVAVILAPHPFHASLARRCVEAGAHVLVEKPLAVHVAEADELIAAADAAGRLVAVCLQQRLRPEIREAARLVAAGEVGVPQRVEVTQAWTRTRAYFDSPWRGTWAGEGGGATLTLAIHHLDLLCHLFGSPARVAAWTRNLAHPIQTEDTVHGVLEWPDGLLGYVHVSSGEAGAPERIEIAGTRAKLALGEGSLTVERFAVDLHHHVETVADPFAPLPSTPPEPVELPPAPGHIGVYENLAAALAGEAPLLADARAARASLELANALVLSSHERREIELPLDAQAYPALLSRHVAASRGTLKA